MSWTPANHMALGDYCVDIQAISVKAREGYADYSDAAALRFVKSQITRAIRDLEESITQSCRQRDRHMQEEAANDTLDSNA